MAKLDIKFPKYLAQDENGDIFSYGNSDPPWRLSNAWFGTPSMQYFPDGKPNPDWENTLIDLETDDYDFDDGILKRLPKKENK